VARYTPGLLSSSICAPQAKKPLLAVVSWLILAVIWVEPAAAWWVTEYLFHWVDNEMDVVADVLVVPLSSNTIVIVPAVLFFSHMENVHVSSASASSTTCCMKPPPVESSSIASADWVPLGAVVEAVFPVWVRLVIVVVTPLNVHPSVPEYMFSCSENLNAFSYLPKPPKGVTAIPASIRRLPVVVELSVIEPPVSPIVSSCEGSVVPMPRKPCMLRVRPVDVALNTPSSAVILNLSESLSSTPILNAGTPVINSN